MNIFIKVAKLKMQTTLSSASSPQSSSKYSPGVFMLGQLKPANHTPHFKPSFD